MPAAMDSYSQPTEQLGVKSFDFVDIQKYVNFNVRNPNLNSETWETKPSTSPHVRYETLC
jgi:hypothetical protein